MTQTNILTGKLLRARRRAVEHRVGHRHAAHRRRRRADELWKLNHYYERLDEWNADHGIAANPFAGPAADPLFELHNLSTDPEERHNRAGGRPGEPRAG